VLPENMLVEREIDPLDIDTARVIIQINIFRTITDIESNPDYDQAEVKKLTAYFSEEARQVESSTNADIYRTNNEKMRAMGVDDVDNPKVGVTYVELNEVYRKEFNETKNCDEIMLYVVASTQAGLFKLSKKPLHEVLGETKEDAWYTHFPYTTAPADPESDDFWSDGPADTLRQPNKVLNSFVSSMTENRTLRNFNMHYYDSSDASFVPQTFTAEPWGWYPVPGNPNEKVKDVIVGDLSESLDEMQFIIGISEKAVGATSVQTGELPPSEVKLGQTQIAVANATQRVKGMILPIKQEYEDFAQKYIWMLEGAGHNLNELKISRKGRQGKNMYTAIVKPEQYLDQAGYVAEVTMKEDQQSQEIATIQKLQVAIQEMPNNVPLKTAYKKRLLDFADLPSSEMLEIMDYDKNNPMLPNEMMGTEVQGANPTGPVGPVNPAPQM
jgi:hypothetical protein